MDQKIFRSKPLVIAVLIVFAAVLGGESFAQIDGQALNEFTKAFQAGKKLYEDGEHKEAALKLLQALTLAKEKGEIAEACFYLSLAYYGLGESDNAQLYLRKLFDAQPEREIDARLFPSGYVTLFYRTKSEFAKPQPVQLEEKPKEQAKAEEKKADLEKKAKEEEKKPVAVGGKAEAAAQVKKKGKFPWLIVGGLVVVTGVVLYLLLNKKKSPEQGTISVASTPAGANVFLDGSDTGLTTACTLSNVSAGAHLVKLVKDGYADFQQNITVTAGQTAAVNASLTKNSIIVTFPASGMIWAKGTSNDIRWQVSSSMSEEKRTAGPGPSGSVVLAPQRTRIKKGTSFSPDPSLKDRSREDRPEAQSQTEAVLGITKVRIELYKGGALVAVIVTETDNNGSYSWQVPGTSTDGSDYKVRVSCSTDSSIYGESGMFTITSGSITVSEPVSGSVWGKGSTYSIKWTGTAGGNVKIDLYKATSFVQTIVGDTVNDGVHSWTIPSSLTDGSDYRIRVSSVADSMIFGESGYFTIGANLYEFVTKWGSIGTGDGQFGTSGPYGIAVDISGNVYVADTGNGRIQKFNSNGVFLAKWGSYGNGDGQFSSPWGITVDNSGFVYVADAGSDRIQKFTSTGTFVSKFGITGTGDGQLHDPHGIGVDSTGNIYVAEDSNQRVQKFNSNGAYLTKWGSQGSADGQFWMPNGLAVDSSANVYVTEMNNHRVQKFNSSGTFLAKWGGYGSGDGQVRTPWGIAVDNSGNVYVAEYSGERISKFTSNGTFVAKWGTTGTGDGQFNKPTGVAVDVSGNVYIAEYGNCRVQKFRPRTGAPPPSLFGWAFGPLSDQRNRRP